MMMWEGGVGRRKFGPVGRWQGIGFEGGRIHRVGFGGSSDGDCCCCYYFGRRGSGIGRLRQVHGRWLVGMAVMVMMMMLLTMMDW